jgi:hypothetical protein
MSRAGVEAKPAWRAVPGDVRERVRDVLGAPVARGMRVWGGYGPTPTYRLLLADGRRAFFKGTNRESNDFMRGAIVREERVYREMAALIGPFAPRFYGAFRLGDWHVLLLEDLGTQTVPPWRPTTARRVAHAYADFHAATLGRDLPVWLPRPQHQLARTTWGRVAEESDGLRAVAELAAGREDEALAWLRTSLPILTRLADGATGVPSPYALLHGDTRSDNLRFTRGRLSLFDWPWAEVGAPEFDLAAFAQSITVEGGPDPERFVAWYGERLPVRADALDALLAWLAAFFADVAWRPEIPGLPRLRGFQRQQLAVVLAWAARRLRLPEPAWVGAMSRI